jgi:predicted transcriptional regulator
MNKKVIRKKKEAGNFTQIPLSILKDKRLSAGAFRALVMILSESDNYKLYKIDLAQKLNVKEKQVQRYFQELEKHGYMRRKPIQWGTYYTISEYGNLVVKKESEPTGNVNNHSGVDITEREVTALSGLYSEAREDAVLNELAENLLKSSVSVIGGKTIVDAAQFKSGMEKGISARLEHKKQIYNALVDWADGRYNERTTYRKAVNDFRKAVRIKLFDNHETEFDYGRVWAGFLIRNRKNNSDPETDRQDNSSGYD